MKFEEYRDRFSTVELARSEVGVLTMRLHNRDDPSKTLRWGGKAHAELPEILDAISKDVETKVVVVTGTGDHFIAPSVPAIDTVASGEIGATDQYRLLEEGRGLILQLLDIPVPVIAAVNGPVDIHSEIALLADVIIAAEDVYFQDRWHFPHRIVPGDGVQVLYPLLLGMNRGRYFLLTGQKLMVEEALSLGLVGEVLPKEQVQNRALEIANMLAVQNPVLLRSTRYMFTRPLKRAMANDLDMGLAMEQLASMSNAEYDELPQK